LDRVVAGDPTERELLETVTKRVEEAGLPGYAWDARWRLVWVSSAVKLMLGEAEEERLGIGEHWLTVRALPPWRVMTATAGRAWLVEHLSLLVGEAGGNVERVRDDIRGVVEDPHYLAEVEDALEEAAARSGPPLPIRASTAEFSEWGELSYLTATMRGHDGALIGTLEIGTPHLPLALLTLLIRGERELFERMARLQEPARREAAILFVDIEASGALSRGLSSAGYFSLIRAVTNGVDETVAHGGGVVGRHAGDGASAFFLVEELGSASQAAAAAIEAARRIREVAETAAADLGLPLPVAINAGAHWGSMPYIGQLTSGRLEVTALGDEVNECARVQEAARAGTLLATKDLLERLDDQDANRLGLDLAAVAYTALADLDGVPPKVIRDAGALSVLRLPYS
jgi:class 3 adenylate cyclase